MTEVTAIQVLMSHLPEITDGAYRTAMKIAIETLVIDASIRWQSLRQVGETLTLEEYLGFTPEEYDRLVNNQ